jgi:hypothetical protein
LDGDPLVVAFASSSDRLAKAIEKLAQGDMDLPPNLYTILKSLPDFNSVHISFYYAHLVANPHIGRAFYNLPSDANMDWVVGLSQRSFLKTSFTSYVGNLITFGFYMCTGRRDLLIIMGTEIITNYGGV